MASTGLKAIETVYNGYRLRSRLEARWAVFFDAAGIQYEYEPQGFDLDGLWYLPDFWLPQQQCWIEIKPQKPEGAESQKAEALALAADCNVYVCYGEVPYPSPVDSGADSAEVWGPVISEDGSRAAWWDDSQWWTHCTRCGAMDLHYCGAEDRLGGECAHSGGPDTPHLRAAYLAARQARFEHGATPITRPRRPQPEMSPVQSILTYCQHYPDRWHTHAELRGCLDRDDAILSGPAISTLLQRGQLRHGVATDGRIVYSATPNDDRSTLG